MLKEMGLQHETTDFALLTISRGAFHSLGAATLKVVSPMNSRLYLGLVVWCLFAANRAIGEGLM